MATARVNAWCLHRSYSRRGNCQTTPPYEDSENDPKCSIETRSRGVNGRLVSENYSTADSSRGRNPFSRARPEAGNDQLPHRPTPPVPERMSFFFNSTPRDPYSRSDTSAHRPYQHDPWGRVGCDGGGIRGKKGANALEKNPLWGGKTPPYPYANLHSRQGGCCSENRARHAPHGMTSDLGHHERGGAGDGRLRAERQRAGECAEERHG